MFSPELDEDEARRVAAFFVDLMATLTTEEVGEEDVTALLRSIWSNRPPSGSGSHDVREDDLIAGFVRVAVAMAHMVVQERRSAGATCGSSWLPSGANERSVSLRCRPGRWGPRRAGAADAVAPC